jgi:cyclopropane fatty-acyl-phospholipid synthase-like methyltransferase
LELTTLPVVELLIKPLMKEQDCSQGAQKGYNPPRFQSREKYSLEVGLAGVQMGKSKSRPPAGHYNANYGNFQAELYAKIRQEAFGEDIGQNSWLTSNEQDKFLEWLGLSPGKTLLDVACGAGGPALRIVATTGCSVVGIDVHEQAITTASALAAQRGLAERAEFRYTDATQPLPFSDASFDAITCIDAINHFSDRPRIIAEWTRLLKLGGRLLFTDPITLTGPLTNEEIAVRSSAGSYLFVPHGYDESIIAQCGLRLLVCEDVTAHMAKIAEARCVARASRNAVLRKIEGAQVYDGQQEFLAVAARVGREGRLSRFVYVSEKLS